MTDDLITRTTEEFRELRKKLTQALRLVERLIEEQRPSIFNEVYLTSEEIRSMFGISKRTLQTYRDEHIIPYTMLGGKFLYPQSAIFEVLERHSEKLCDEICIESPENRSFSGLCIFLASYSIKLQEWTIYTRSFVVPVNSDRMPVQRQAIFPSERFADGLYRNQNTWFCRYKLLILGMLSHDFQTTNIDIIERRDLSAYDALDAQTKIVFMP